MDFILDIPKLEETIARLGTEITQISDIKTAAKKECEQLTSEAWTGRASDIFLANHQKWSDRLERYITKMTILKEVLTEVLARAEEANKTALEFAEIMGGAAYEGSRKCLSIDWERKEKLSRACGQIREHYEEYAAAIQNAQGKENSLCYTSFYLTKAQPTLCKIGENEDCLILFQSRLNHYEEQIRDLEAYLIDQLDSRIIRLNGDLWLSAVNPWVQRTATAMTALREKGYSDDEYRILHEHGFTDEEILNLVSTLKTKEDKRLFEQILGKNYKEAFQIPPDQVSLGGQAFLAMYAFHLLDQGNLKELEEFTNGILYVDKEHSIYTGTSYAETYIRDLYRMNTVIMEAEAESFYTSSLLSDKTKKELSARNKTLMELTTYWGAMDSLFSPDLYTDTIEEIRSMELMYGYKIGGLRQSGEGLSFDCTYLTARIGNAGLKAEGKNIMEIIPNNGQKLHVNGFQENSTIKIDNVQVLDNIEKLLEEKERLKVQYAANGIIGVSAAVHPVLGMLGNLAMGISDGNATKTSLNTFSLAEKSGMFHIQTLQNLKSGMKGSSAVLTNWLDYNKAAANVDKKIEKEKWEKSVRMFGCVGGVHMSIKGETIRTELVYSGLSDPGRLAALGRWAEKGLAGLGDERLDNEMVKKIKAKFGFEPKNIYRMTEEIATLLDGDNDIRNIDMGVLLDSINKIEGAYHDLAKHSKNPTIDISTIFEKAGVYYEN